jgi:uncharacterized protein (DUF2141 family)
MKIVFLWPCINILSLGLIAADISPSKTNTLNQTFDRSQYFGEPVTDKNGKLQHVEENKNQTHNRDNFVMVRVKNIKQSESRKTGRIRVAVWEDKNSFAKEGQRPFRAASHWAKDTNENNEMVFKIGGLIIGKSYAFFAHFDEQNSGKVARNIIGIPKDQFIFSNGKNQGKGPGLTREGLSAPKFESTLVKYESLAQEVVLILK